MQRRASRRRRTGKTRTLQVLAEQLSSAGVPVFAADIKGDLSGFGPVLLSKVLGLNAVRPRSRHLRSA